MAEKSGLTHFDESGKAHMVDVGDKSVTDRTAVAQGSITMSAETLELIRQGGHKKGDVLGIARTAGIMAAKKTPELVPLCHPLMLTHVGLDFELDEKADFTVILEAMSDDDQFMRKIVSSRTLHAFTLYLAPQRY